MSGEAIEMTGVVQRVERGDFYVVCCKLGDVARTVLVRRSGRLVRNHILVLPGDVVTVECTPYDPGKGRITYRGRRQPREPAV
jgi:translation initiation factor IF-1